MVCHSQVYNMDYLIIKSFLKQKISRSFIAMKSNLFNSQVYKQTNHLYSIDPAKRFITPKLLTQQSSELRTPNDNINYHNPNFINEASKSETFIHPQPSIKYYDSVQIKSQTLNKNKPLISLNIRSKAGSQKNDFENLFHKKQMDILKGTKKNMYKTQYAKIIRRKQQIKKRNLQIQDQQRLYCHKNSNNKINKISEQFSEEKLLQKYRELMQKRERSKPFNMINKLYKMDYLSSKQALITTKDNFKSISTISKQIEGKVTKIFSKPEYQTVKQILSSNSPQKCDDAQYVLIKRHFSEERQDRNILINKKTTFEKQQLQRVRQPKAKDKCEAATNIPKNNQNKLCQLSSNDKETIYPQPKKLNSAAYLIYQVSNKKQKAINKKLQLDTKKKDYLGKIHLSSNMKTSSQIASLTKIMTCIITIDICQRFQINPAIQKHRVGLFQSHVKGTSADIEPGEIYTIDQLMHGLMLPSGNDASLALARWGGNILLIHDNDTWKKSSDKSEVPFEWARSNKFIKYNYEKLKPKRCYNRFIAEMNKKARTLGLERTIYVNSHGLSNPLNKSCCIDIALLCEHVMQNNHFRRIVGCKQFSTTIDKQIEVNQSALSKKRRSKRAVLLASIDPEQMNLEQDIEDQEAWDKYDELEEDDNDEEIVEQKRVQLIKKSIAWTNTHKLLHKQEYLGIKTGVTATAGACLASYLQINERYFIIVVLNSKKLIQRFTDTQILKDWLLKKQKMYTNTSKIDRYASNDFQ